MKVLCVAEKPSVARSIAGILSGGQYQSRNTPVGFIKNMDFSYQLQAGRPYVDFTVTAVAGHLTSSDFTDQHRKWNSCDPFALFDAPITRFVSKDNNMQGIERNLLNEARRADELMIWTDCDREGEHIGSEVAAVCRKANPRIRITRARFSAIIAAQIHRACKNTVPLDMNQAAAVETRMDLDLRIGAALTRIQTMKLQNAFPGVLENVISYGSCQFPTLGFVVERYNEVQNFVSEPFWYIYVALERDEFNVNFKWKRNHLFDHQAVLVLFEQCVLQPEATVTAVDTKPTSKWKPLPLTTVELQKHGSRLLRLPPKKVLEAAEALYHKGLVSYPRTETDQFDPQFNFHELIERQRQDGAWGQFASMLLDNGGYERPRNGRKNDKAHPPIHPVQSAGNLQGDEKRVYEYITRRYLAMCSKNATGAKTEVDIVISGEEFKASGLVVHQRNYLDVFPYDRWEGMHLPPFQRNETFMPSVCEMREGQTTAPLLLTEADLVSLMDKNGIGTDATIAEHISKIIDREYAMRQRNGGKDYLVPSTLGIGLVEGYNRIGFDKSLSKPHLRAETEQRMTMICEGQRTKNDVLNETIEEYKEVYMKTKQQFATLVDSVREFIEGNGGGPVANANQGGGPGNGHNGGGGGNNNGGSDDDDDSDGGDGGPGGGRGGRGRGNGRGRGAGGREGRGGGVAPGTRNQAPPARNTAAPAARGGAANRGGRGGGAGPAGNGRPFPKKDDNDENHFDGGQGPQCGCQQPTVERTVFKEGPNTGRKFWSCSKQRDEGCGFFEWADGQQNGGAGGGGAGGGNNGGSYDRTIPKKRTAADIVGGTEISSAPRCPCDLVAASRVCSKDGPNQGRTFYTCSKVSSTKCRFFEWAEEGTVPMTTNRYENNSNKRIKPVAGAAGIGNGDGGCFNCGANDHWSNACPQGKPDRGQGGGGGGAAGGTGECFNCGESGHWSNACPQPKAGGNAGGYSNNAGGGAGGGGTGGDCFICGEPGHWSRDCPQKANEGGGGNNYSKTSYSSNNRNGGAAGGGGGSNFTCFRCGEPGHLSTNCTQEGGNGGSGNSYNNNSTYSKRATTTKRGRETAKGRGSRGGGRGASTSRRGRGGKKTAAAAAGYDDYGGAGSDDYGGNGYDDEGY